MSDTMTLTPATEQTPSLNTTFVACSRKGCRWNLAVGTGFVPNSRRLYWLVRKSEPNRALPLTRAEILSQEFCADCARRAMFDTVPTVDMLGLMEYWAAENISRKESALDSKAAYEERARARRLAAAIRNENRSPINRLLAERKVDEKPRPKYRTHKHIPSAPSAGVKKYGDERKPVVENGDTKRKKKGKPNDDSKKKGKGR